MNKKVLLLAMAGALCCGMGISRVAGASVQSQAADVLYSPPPKESPSPQSPTYSETEINLSTQKLPINYFGNDPRLIYGSLMTMLGPKGEFETTDQYKQRINENQEKPLFGNLTSNSMFASEIQLDTKYDADKSQLRFYSKYNLDTILPGVLMDPQDLSSDTFFPILSMASDTSITGSYTGHNSYGAKTVITKETINNYALAIKNFASVGAISKDEVLIYFSFLYNVPMKPSVAQASKDNWDTLVIYTLAPPFTYTDEGRHSTPTMTNPYAKTVNKYYLNATVKEIWFYNSQTGEIYYKFKPQT